MKNSQSIEQALLLLQLEEERRKRGLKSFDDRSLTFREYVQRVAPKYKWYRHCVILADVLQRVADGEIKRLMVFMPPRHGKSEETSRLFSSYFVYRFPERWAAISSYSADLAYTLSRSARDHYTNAGGKVRDDASAVKQWYTPEGGGLWATGVGGPATGKGFHLGICDDPLKNAEDASSSTIRDKQKAWWDSTWSTREEPDGAMIVIQTRWHEDDLSGWLLSLEANDEEAENWHIVNFPAICEEEDERLEFPPNCTIEPEFRQPGEPLCPERYPLFKLLKRKAKSLQYYWNAIFQQRPKAIEGNKFKRDHFTHFGEPPRSEDVQRVRYWDLAKSDSKKADYTVGVLMSMTSDGIVTVEDVVRFRKTPKDRNAEMRAACERDLAEFGTYVPNFIEYAPGLAEEAIENIIKDLRGFSVSVDRPKGDKTSRAEPFQTYCEAGNVRIVKAGWNRDYIEEMIAFDTGTHDDQVDATSGAFKMLSNDEEIGMEWY
jgi:predicted phage terminase large subunit-like protein